MKANKDTPLVYSNDLCIIRGIRTAYHWVYDLRELRIMEDKYG